MDPFRPDPGGDPCQPSGQRGGGGRGAVSLEEEEDEQRPPEQPSPAECLVFSVRVDLAVAVAASVRASIAQSIPY